MGSLYYASGSSFPSPVTVQAQIIEYCVYQLTFLVTMVQASPETTDAGTTLEIVFKVEWPDGTPVVLQPELGDFLILNPNYSRIYQRNPVFPTGTPGVYRTSIQLAADIPDGTYTAYVIHCTLTGTAGAIPAAAVGTGGQPAQPPSGPPADISSNETPIATDRSQFGIRTPVTQPPTEQPTNLTLLVGLLVTLLVLALLALLILRRRRKK